MNNKFLKLGIGFIVLLLLMYSIFTAIKRGNKNPAGQSDTISIKTPSGPVTIPDVTKNPIQQTADAVAVAEAGNYHIVYYPKDQAFLISITDQPAQPARDAAEAAFIQTLKISKDQACQLNVSLTVPYGVDQNLAGKNYGLSFCPGGLPF